MIVMPWPLDISNLDNKDDYQAIMMGIIGQRLSNVLRSTTKKVVVAILVSISLIIKVIILFLLVSKSLIIKITGFPFGVWRMDSLATLQPKYPTTMLSNLFESYTFLKVFSTYSFSIY